MPYARSDDPVEPRPVDARRAVVDAARHDGLTCQRGAYRGRRTAIEPWPMKPGERRPTVELEVMDPGGGWSWAAHVAVVPFYELRDDWKHPTPVEPGETVLPESEYDVAELFVDGAAAAGLPGMSLPSGGDHDDHRLAGALPDEQPAAPPWADDDGGGGR